MGGGEGLPDGWTAAADVVGDAAGGVLGVSSGRRRKEEGTWWWGGGGAWVCEGDWRGWGVRRDGESGQECREMRRRAGGGGEGRGDACGELYEGLDAGGLGGGDIVPIGETGAPAGEDVTQVGVVRDRDVTDGGC